MRRLLLVLSTATLLGVLSGCHVTTGICDCDCLPPPVIHPAPMGHAGMPMMPGAAPAVTPMAAPPSAEMLRVVPMPEAAPMPAKLPNR